MNFKVSLMILFVGLSACHHKTVYSDNEIKSLQGIQVGNGITLNPIKKSLLISKSSGKMDKNNKPYYRIYNMSMKDGKWCCEEQVSFSSSYTDYHPVFSPDGKWVYFNSTRPIPGDSLPSAKVNIWRVSSANGTFAEPEYLMNINTLNHESYPTITSDGTLYFNSDRPGGMGSMDIYKSASIDGEFVQPTPVGDLNSADSENDLTISPNGDRIVFNRYLFEDGQIELFMSNRQNTGNWSVPEYLENVNSSGWELTPTFSPDGKYFLYELEGQIQVVQLGEIIK